MPHNHLVITPQLRGAGGLPAAPLDHRGLALARPPPPPAAGGGGGGKGRSGTATAFAYESPVLSSYTDTATEVFSSIFKYLDDMFNALPPATVEKLRRMPCIPVGAGGSRLVQPCHM
jgi:hypothetical protein